MRILHVVPTYLPAVRYGGPIYSVHGLCQALAGAGHEVQVFTTSVDGAGDSDVPLGTAVMLDGVQVWYFAARVLRRLYYSPTMLQALKQRVPAVDLVHLHSVFLWPTWAAARAARAAGVPYVLSPRGMLVPELIRRRSRWLKRAWIGLIERRNIEQAAAIHVTSAKEAEALQAFALRLPPVWNIANGIETPRPRSARTLSADVREVVRKPGYVLFLGRINWKKGLDRLLSAWKEMGGAQLVIAGNDEEHYLPQLQRLVAELALQSSVTFLARHIAGNDKEALFASARLFVLPSYSENFGNTVLEALIRGVPVVVTEEVGAGEVVRQGGGGVVVPAEALARTISALLADSAGLQRMGEQGAAWVRDHFTWSGVAAVMADHYRKVAHA